MTPQDAQRAVHRDLQARGFTLLPPRPGAEVSYEGSLPFRGQSVRIGLDIFDWDFQRRPDVRLLERPPALSGFRPHLGAGASICYIEREAVFMDPYDPVGMIAACLKEAEGTLEEIAGNRQRVNYQDEFVAHWSSDTIFPLLLWSSLDLSKRSLSALTAKFAHLKVPTSVITDDASKTTDVLLTSGCNVTSATPDSVVELKTKKPPAIDPDHWPPLHLGNVLTWLDGWDGDLRKVFMGQLESQWTKDATDLVTLIDSPAGRFGFSFSLASMSSEDRKYYAKRPGDRRQRILKMDPPIKRFSLADMSPDFVHARNIMDGSTFAGKRISVIGCGTVGGYLSTFLARLGAGHGGGSLTLYDEQELWPENIGRHILSMRDLFRNKAEGVADLLRQELPWLKVLVRKVNATQVADLFETDLIIDVSGLSAVSSAVNRKHIERLKNGKAPAVLYGWVEGPGDASRCLLVDKLEFMCHECLYVREPGQPPQDRFTSSTRNPSEGRQYPGGCGSYMPFAVSASVATAAMCLDLARDWAQGNPHPRLRFQHHDLGHTHSQKNQSPLPLQSCPACRRA